jgi:nucleoside permease NupC
VKSFVGVVGGALRAALGTSALESACAAANVFLGQSEAPLLLAPLLPRARCSELHSVMTSGAAPPAPERPAAGLPRIRRLRTKIRRLRTL